VHWASDGRAGAVNEAASGRQLPARTPPHSANLYDCLGPGYLESDARANAVAIARPLASRPGNRRAEEMSKILRDCRWQSSQGGPVK
jgi:hypothetical protein